MGQEPGNTVLKISLVPGVATTRVFSVNPGMDMTIEGLTIRNGNVTGDGGCLKQWRADH